MFNRRTLVPSFIATASFKAFTATLAAANVLGISSIVAPAALAQDSGQVAPGQGNKARPGKKGDEINARLRRQSKKIDAALKNGRLSEQQANRLHR